MHVTMPRVSAFRRFSTHNNENTPEVRGNEAVTSQLEGE